MYVSKRRISVLVAVFLRYSQKEFKSYGLTALVSNDTLEVCKFGRSAL